MTHNRPPHSTFLFCMLTKLSIDWLNYIFEPWKRVLNNNYVGCHFKSNNSLLNPCTSATDWVSKIFVNDVKRTVENWIKYSHDNFAWVPAHALPACCKLIFQCTASTLPYEQQCAQFNKIPMQSVNAALLYCKTKINQPLQHLRNK